MVTLFWVYCHFFVKKAENWSKNQIFVNIFLAYAFRAKCIWTKSLKSNFLNPAREFFFSFDQILAKNTLFWGQNLDFLDLMGLLVTIIKNFIYFFAYYYSSSYSLHKNIDLIHFEKLPLIVRVSETFFICIACEIGRIWPRNSKTAHTIFFFFFSFLAKNKPNEIKETISGALWLFSVKFGSSAKKMKILPKFFFILFTKITILKI